MTTRHTLAKRLGHTTALLALLVAAGGAQAVYIETPLLIDVAGQVKVGDVVDITISPANETHRATYAGRVVKIVAVDFETQTLTVIVESLTLDDAASAKLQWTVPVERDAQNLEIRVLDAERTVAFEHVAVGDAEPMAFALGKGDLESQSGPTDDKTADPPAAATPDAGLVAAVAAGLVAAVAIAAVTARRK